MKEQPGTQVTHFWNSNFKHKMKGLQILQKPVYEVAVVKKYYVHETAAVNLSIIKNSKQMCSMYLAFHGIFGNLGLTWDLQTLNKS